MTLGQSPPRELITGVSFIGARFYCAAQASASGGLGPQVRAPALVRLLLSLAALRFDTMC